MPAELRYDVAPKIRSVAVPVYPYELKKAGLTGRVTATFTLDDRGHVIAVTIVKAPRPEFGLALKAALEHFRFDPALRGGKPVPAMLRFEQTFNNVELPDEAGDRVVRLEKNQPDRIVPAAKLDRMPRAISQRPPKFPVGLPPHVTTGRAVVDFILDDKGRVRVPRIASASDPAFGYAAVQAVSTWWFEPPLAHGKPALIRVSVPIEFAAPATPSPDLARASAPRPRQ